MGLTTVASLRRLQRRRWVWLGAALLAVATFAAALVWRDHGRVGQGQAALLDSRAELIQQQLSTTLGGLTRAMRGIAQHVEERIHSPDDLALLVDAMPVVGELSYFDAAGELVMSSSARPVIGPRDDTGMATTAVTAEDARFTLAPLTGALADRFMIGLRLPLRRADGTPLGTVTGALDASLVQSQLDALEIVPGVWAGIADGHGRILMMSRSKRALVGLDISRPSSLFSRHASSGRPASFIVGPTLPDGERRLVAMRDLEPAGMALAPAPIVAVARGEAETYAAWTRMAWAVGLTLVVAGLALAAGLWRVHRSERRHAEELERNRGRLDLMARTVPGAICQFELQPDGRIRMPFATRPLRPLFGLDASLAPGSADVMFDHMHPDDVDRVRTAIVDSGKTLTPFVQEWRMRLPGRPERWIEVHGMPERQPDGGTLWTGFAADVTAMHEAREAQSALEAAERANRAKSEFLSRASHELRTPLNAVIGFASLLEGPQDPPLSDTQRAQVGHIRESGEHLLHLIDDLLDVSAIEAGRFKATMADVALAPLVAEALPALGAQAEHAGVTLEAAPVDPALTLRADPVRLRQVVFNLLSNAIKYNRAGGSVTVRAAHDADGMVRVDIADTGRGLDADQRSHLFEAFNRLGAEQHGIEGTGVGLVISRMLVERMGGRMAATSEPGRGSCFSFWLRQGEAPAPGAGPARSAAARPGAGLPPAPSPMAPAATQTAGPPAGSAARSVPAAAMRAAAPPGPALDVLLVEDNPMNAELMRQFVRLRPAVRLRVADCGSGALDEVASRSPDLMLVDMNLGDMHGVELLHRLRADAGSRAPRCVAVSADAMPAQVQAARDAGFSDYLTKPVDLKALLALLDAAAHARAAAAA